MNGVRRAESGAERISKEMTDLWLLGSVLSFALFLIFAKRANLHKVELDVPGELAVAMACFVLSLFWWFTLPIILGMAFLSHKAERGAE